MRKMIFLSGLLALVLVACKNNAADQSFFDTQSMDSSVHPGDNFFVYANGGWIKTAKIPDDQSGWGSFYTLYDENQTKLKALMEKAAAAGAANGSLEQKVGDFYTSGMDTALLEKKGAAPLQTMLQKIAAAPSVNDLMVLLAGAEKTGEGASFLSFYVGADERRSSHNILTLSQSGLSLPEKDYYTKKDSFTVGVRQQFQQHVARYFELTGMAPAAAQADAAAVLALETSIAASHRSPVELRDPLKNYNKMAVTDLAKTYPNLPWAAIFSAMGIQPDSINLAQPRYYAGLGQLLKTVPLAAFKAKARYDYVAGKAGLLSKAFRDENFAFNKTFSGAKKQSDRWKQMVSRTDNSLKDLVGQLYVAAHFPPESKKRMDELVNNLQAAFEKRIGALDWMSDSTKTRAKEKMGAFLKKIGYPSTWKNYDDVTIKKDALFENALQVAAHDYKETMAKLGQPVDKTEWGMTAPTVNAYYNPTFNEIVFPAGILQFPFFDGKADDAINYGAIGMVIGHEMTHGFDDQGRQYDAQGNLKDWWTASDAEKFKAKAGGVVAQYNNYVVLDSLHVNGALTLGENLADIGGLAIAYDAFKMTPQGKGQEKIDGFTPEQRFFLGYAQVWRLINRPETMRTRITTDPHSPEEYRVNGPLANFDPFYQAFGVTEKHKLYRKPADRAKIW
ncbi:MAG: M13 family peptidase [Sphingobacteriia bacterium]|nr:MAG: M13 family peptidase [Sphingobacteriia bacterium]